MTTSISERLNFTINLARQAGEVGMTHFRHLDKLEIEQKGHQDLVSNADRELEDIIRDAIAETYPDDGIVGEEYGRVKTKSGYTWIIDPIDGTANFVSGIPAWCVVIACVDATGAVVGVTHEPSVGETFAAARGMGTKLNGQPLKVSASQSLAKGSMGCGFSNRTEVEPILAFLHALTGEGGVYFRNASGALMLAYVAAGRLIGYAEPHMNPWDCVAGLLQIEEAGGKSLPADPAEMLANGAPVIAGCPGVYDKTLELATKAFHLTS